MAKVLCARNYAHEMLTHTSFATHIKVMNSATFNHDKSLKSPSVIKLMTFSPHHEIEDFFLLYSIRNYCETFNTLFCLRLSLLNEFK
jgi:hypothetical protein